MTVHTRQVISASHFEGNSANRKIPFEGNTANRKATIKGTALRGEAAIKHKKSTVLDRLRRSKLVPLPQSC
jgi:hypothetical protein